MVKLCFYVPATHLEVVKQALFDVGAGRIGDYDSCCWQTLGTGQFRPLAGSKPFIGEAGGGVEKVEEYKVELVCEDDIIKSAVVALRRAHPYEEPAFDLIQLMETTAL